MLATVTGSLPGQRIVDAEVGVVGDGPGYVRSNQKDEADKAVDGIVRQKSLGKSPALRWP